MTRIKICGITNHEDARAASDYGAHMLGFILVPDSPRFIGHLDSFQSLEQSIDIECVAVLRDAVEINSDDPAMVQFSAFQVYQDTRNLGEDRASDRLIPAFRIRGKASVEEVVHSRLAAEWNTILLDAYDPDRLGGAG